MNAVYKIRNPQGLFSRGGSMPLWSKKGKTWTSLQALKSHLTMLRKDKEDYGMRYDKAVCSAKNPYARDFYAGCEVLEFTYVPTQSATSPIVNYTMATTKATSKDII